MSAFYGGIYLIAIGAGGIKPCVPPLGGDQFDDSVPAEKKKRPLYFNLLFWSLQIGVLFVLTGIVYIQVHTPTCCYEFSQFPVPAAAEQGVHSNATSLLHAGNQSIVAR